jgi:hypothetical protein
VCHPIETSSNKRTNQRDAKPLENTATAPTSSLLFAARRLPGPIFMVAGKRNVVHAGLGVQQTHENSGLPTTHRRVQLNSPSLPLKNPAPYTIFLPTAFLHARTLAVHYECIRRTLGCTIASRACLEGVDWVGSLVAWENSHRLFTSLLRRVANTLSSRISTCSHSPLSLAGSLSVFVSPNRHAGRDHAPQLTWRTCG